MKFYAEMISNTEISNKFHHFSKSSNLEREIFKKSFFFLLFVPIM